VTAPHGVDGDRTAAMPPAGAAPAAVVEAGRQLRAPWAASIAGLLFAVLFTAALLMMRSSP
jgi:hypothetical protein